MFREHSEATQDNSFPITLSSAARKAIFGLVVFVAAFALAGYAWLDYSAARSASAGTAEGMQRALRLAPGNARYWYLAGTYSLFGAQNPEAATQEFATSTRLNPWSADAWLSLANAYQVNGDIDKERAALESAINADPKTPDVAWQAANFYLVEDDIPKAARLFSVVVENDADPERSNRAFQLLWASKPDVNFILDNSLPPIAERHFSLLNLLCEKGQFDAALSVWNRILQLNQPFPSKSAYPFLDYLLNTKHSDQAAVVWEQLADKNPAEIPHRGPNLVVNSSFEDAISNGGFDWRYRFASGVKITVDPVVAVSGSRSLMIVFDGAPSDAGIAQYVPVTPNTKYHLGASMRSDDIQSGSGPRLAVYDAYQDKQYAVTDDMLETNVWRRQDVDFVTGPDTRLVIVRIIREPSSPMIKGKLWIDDVQLTKE